MPTNKLARIVYKENKLSFKDVEDARYLLRYIEGKGTSASRKTEKQVIKRKPDRPLNPYNLPKSYIEERKPFKLPRLAPIYC